MRLQELLILIEGSDSPDEIIASMQKRPKLAEQLIANANASPHIQAGKLDQIIYHLEETLAKQYVDPRSYLRWVIYRAAETPEAFHPQVGQLIKAFEAARQNHTAKFTDINQYRSFKEFKQEFMESALNSLKMHRSTDTSADMNNEHYVLQYRQKMLNEGEAELLFTSSKADLVLIKTFNAMVAFGSPHWCSSQQVKHWDRYDNGQFAVLIFNSNPLEFIYAIQSEDFQFQSYHAYDLPRKYRNEILKSVPREITDILRRFSNPDFIFKPSK